MDYRRAVLSDAGRPGGQHLSNHAHAQGLLQSARVGIDGPEWVVVPKGTRVWRFCTEKYAPKENRRGGMLAPWWFPQSTLDLIRDYASRYFRTPLGMITPFMMASAARKCLAVWYGWNDMNLLCGATFREDTVLIAGEGKKIPYVIAGDEQRAAKERRSLVHANSFDRFRGVSVMPVKGAIQFYVPGISRAEPTANATFEALFTGITSGELHFLPADKPFIAQFQDEIRRSAHKANQEENRP